MTLALRCQLDGAVKRYDAQFRKRIAILSGGETSPAAVTFASGHVETYKEGVKFFEGVWLPAGVIPSKNTTFFWDRSAVPWKFSLGATSGAEEVTMSGLLGMLGMGGEPEHEPEVEILYLSV